jgi:hypothetical protein
MLMRKTLPLVLIGTAFLAAGCSDAANDGTLMPPSTDVSAVPGQTAEAAALAQITRAVALAMQDQGLRQVVRNDLRASRFTPEHKLPFSDYLHGNGGILLAKMARETGRSREDLLALLGQVRPLEFYMPVPAHRESWTGGSELLVAGLLEDHTVPAAYALNGSPVQLQAETAPTTPTLAIVPVETRFNEPLQGALQNANDRAGQAIGTWTRAGGPSLMVSAGECGGGAYQLEYEACDTGGGGGGGGGTVVKPGGLYMTYSNVTNDGEAWTKGAPEIEVHIHGPNGGDKTYGADLACAGEHSTDPFRSFNQDSRTWSGEVLLFNQQQITEYNTKYGSQGFNLMLWEDDDTSCTIKTDKNMTSVLAGIAGVVGAAAVVIEKPGATSSWVKAAGLFVGALYASASWLLSNDDFLGAAPQVTTNALQSTLYTNSSSTNGYINTQVKYMQ